MADTPVTAQSILTSFLLSSTSFTTPSLTSLRSLAPTQSTDSQLKQWHREVLQHRNSLRGQVEEEIKAYKLVPKGLVRQVKRELKVKEEEEALDEGEEGERLSLGEAIARLEKEEKLLGVEVQDVQDGIEQRKRTLDAFAQGLEELELPPYPPPPSLKRDLEQTLGGLERDVKKYRGLVDGINERASAA